MTEAEALARFGLTPAPADLPAVRTLLEAQAAAERRAQGDGDTPLMRLLCVQLFAAGHLEDALRVWQARTSSLDAGASIEVQLVCGAGLVPTRTHLAGAALPEAAAALRRLTECEAAGDLEDFTPDAYRAGLAAYFGVDADDA